MIQRKNYFIKKKFQASFFLKFSSLLLLEGLLIAVFFMYIARGSLTAAYKGGDFVLEKTGAFFFIDFAVMTLIVGVAIAVAAGIVFMYLSHRIGGALYRFEKTLEDAKSGDFAQRVTLRKTDELFDMKDKFNAFLETMDNRVAGIRQDADKCAQALDSNNPGMAKDALQSLKRALQFFKTSR